MTAVARDVVAAGFRPTEDARRRLMLVRLRISQWNGRRYDKGASDDVAKLHALGDDASDVGRFNKILVDPELLRPVQHAAGALKKAHYRLTAPWMGEGPRILTAALYFEYGEEIRARVAELDAEAARFALAYPREVEDARRRLGDLFAESEYPAPETIAARFGARVRFEPLPDPDDARILDLGDDAGAEIADGVRESLEQGIAESHRAVVEDLRARAREFVEKVRRYDRGEAKTIRKTALSNLTELAGTVVRGLNVADDPDLETFARYLEGVLSAVDVEQLREFEGFRRGKADSVEAVLRKFEGAYGSPQ